MCVVILLQLIVNISNVFLSCSFSEINIYLCISIIFSCKINLENAGVLWMKKYLFLLFLFKNPKIKIRTVRPVKPSNVHMSVSLVTSPKRRTLKIFLNEILSRILGPKGRQAYRDENHWLCDWSLWLINSRSGHMQHVVFEECPMFSADYHLRYFEYNMKMWIPYQTV
jgi:hypothetical protein